MLDGPENPYIFDPDRVTKIEGYRKDIPQSGYPLLYAVCLDLAQYDSNPSLQYGGAPAVILRENESQENIEFLRDNITAAIHEVEQSGIPFFPGHSINNRLDYQHLLPGKTSADVAAKTRKDLQLFQRGLRVLAEPLGQIPFAQSLTSQVQSLLDEVPSPIQQGYQSRKGIKTVIDGVFSTYIAATTLSQMPLPGLEGLSTKERLLTVLRSDAPTELAKIAELSMVSNLGKLSLNPHNQLQPGRYTDFSLHPDEIKFIRIANRHIASKVPHPIPCPFARPLGENNAQLAINNMYGGRLPTPVVNMVKANTRVSGIKTTGQAIASFLEKRL